MQIRNNPWYKAYPNPDDFLENVPMQMTQRTYDSNKDFFAREWEEKCQLVYQSLKKKFDADPECRSFDDLFYADSIVKFYETDELYYVLPIKIRVNLRFHNLSSRSYYLDTPSYNETMKARVDLKAVTNFQRPFAQPLEEKVPFIKNMKPSTVSATIDDECKDPINTDWLNLPHRILETLRVQTVGHIKWKFFKDARLKNYLEYVKEKKQAS